MARFDDETALRELAPGTFAGHVSGAWNIGDNPNGGYLASIGLRAMTGLGQHRDPLSVTCHFLRPGTPAADAEVSAELIRTGRTLTTARAALAQQGKQRLEILAALGDLSAAADSPELAIEPPEMPDPLDCPIRSGDQQGVDLGILSRLEIRLHPGQAEAGKAGRPEVSGWIRFADGRPTDSLSLPLFADAFPPSLFGLLGNTGWVPTVEITVHVRRRPAPGWIMGRFTTADLRDGRMIEDGVLWDETGALVARSRQLALLLT